MLAFVNDTDAIPEDSGNCRQEDIINWPDIPVCPRDSIAVQDATSFLFRRIYQNDPNIHDIGVCGPCDQ